MLRLAILLALIGAACVAAVSVAAPARDARPRAPKFVASYDVVLSGGLERQRHADSQASDPQDSVVVESDDSYSGRGILTLKEEDNGLLVPSSNSFAYQSATWHLSGQNGTNGSFDCNPTVTTTDGTVDAAGRVVGGVLYVRFILTGTHEHNDKWDCGADFSGFATDSEYEGESLLQVEDAQPGGKIVTSADNPSVGTLQDVEDTGTAPNTKHSVAKWTITITERSGSSKDDGPPGPSTSPRPTSSTRKVCTISGTAHADALAGTSGDDVICAYGGNDRIDGRGGHDLIYGGLGKDTIQARDKTVDRVDGGPGKDKGTFDRSPRDKVARVEHAAFG
jgi:Ca2+-binding RTX toxin-like protein